MCAALSEKASVLLITRTPRDHQAILAILQQQKFCMTIETDGESGYQKAQLTQPNLILLDSATPRIPTLALVRMLSGLSATAHIPIIYLENSATSHGGTAALQAGAIDYLSCPYQAEELLERIQIHIRLSHGTSFEPDDELKTALQRLHQTSGRQMEDQILLQTATGMIKENLKTPLTQKALADWLQVPERRLVAVFMKCLNVRPHEYISDQRLQLAERLISTTTLSLTLIAEELGFSSLANFSTAFKKYKGISPREFRKQPFDIDV